MEFFPELAPTLPGGWTLMLGFYIAFILFLRMNPKEVTSRLYELSGWKRIHPLINRSVSLATFGYLALFIATPLSSDPKVLRVGLILFALGFSGIFSAFFTYAKAALDKPITEGLYRYSRNPQWIFLALMTLGICIAIGSWSAVVLLVITAIGYHFRLLGEEEVLEEQYGDAYLEYKKRVPRYFLIV